MTKNNSPLLLWLCVVNVVIINSPLLVSSECTCDAGKEEEESHGNDSSSTEPLKYKLIAISTILISGAMGISFPILGKRFPPIQPGSKLFFLVKSFAPGVIISTGFVHILPDAFESLASPCLAKTNPARAKFPFAPFIAMLSAILTMMIEVLEVGIVVHSVIIGISLGTSESAIVIKPLVAALSFQFFEGMGLGGCISHAEFRCRAVVVMVLFFSLTTPTGIAIGIGISHIYDDNSPTALIVEGLLNSASAGILICMALVDLIAQDSRDPKLLGNLKLMVGANISLFLGMGSMSLLAKWV